MLPPSSQRCIRAAFRLYGGILDEVVRADYDVFVRRATVPRRRRLAVAAASVLTPTGRALRPPGPMTDRAYDAVVAGGGLSGLSLAAHLAAGGWRDRHVLVVDDPRRRPTATAWAWWSDRPGLLDVAVSRSFDRVGVHAAGTARVVRLGAYRYRVVRRDALRQVVLAMLDRSRFGDAGSCRRRMRPGRSCRGGRGRPHGPRRLGLRQRPGRSRRRGGRRPAFTGYEVHSGRAVFDPDAPVLFDFRTSAAAGARFAYVLPENAHRALVE